MKETYRVIHQDYAHHAPAEPLRKHGSWVVFAREDVPKGWPGDGNRLALTLTEEQIDALDPTEYPLEPLELPEPLPVPEPEQYVDHELEAWLAANPPGAENPEDPEDPSLN